LVAFWDRRINPANYLFEVIREKILEDSILKTVKVTTYGTVDPLKLPLKI
jgi:hypothetical protein